MSSFKKKGTIFARMWLPTKLTIEDPILEKTEKKSEKLE